LGLGTAYVAGFRWALERDYQAVFEMDADFSHSPAYLPDFRVVLEQGADLILGSRYIKGGGVRNWNFWRRILSRAGSFYARTILAVNIRDFTGGFKCFRRTVLENIEFSKIKSNGYSFQIEMTYRALKKGFKVVEIPIVFEERALGASKMSKKIFLEAVFMVWLLKFSYCGGKT
jgi:dolichol-phosphate mannosyltransferase